jgi:ATP-dependent DNA helicase PIF1
MRERIRLSHEQDALFHLMERTREHLFITGRAGTGKSILLTFLRDHSKKQMVVVAPTGIAALNVRGTTIHSLFRLPPTFIKRDSLSPDSRLASVLRRIETVVIDEASMVRADLMDAIDFRLRQACANSLPFGGKQLLLFGDLYQLPPVVDDEDLLRYFAHTYGGPYFFQAAVWQQARFTIYELTKIFRQKEQSFKEILNAVREGTMTSTQLERLNLRAEVPIPDEGVITLAATNALVAEINQTHLAALPSEIHEYQADIVGKLERSAFPTEEILQLKVGAQVMLLRNDREHRWVNGTLGTIDSLSKTEIKVRVGSMVYSVPRETWEKIRYTYNEATRTIEEEVISSFTQFPLRLAWAVTIHKSQGQTYEAVVVDLTHDTFAPGQLYVALSRCTSQAGLYLKTSIKPQHLMVSPEIIAFMQQKQGSIPTHRQGYRTSREKSRASNRGKGGG